MIPLHEAFAMVAALHGPSSVERVPLLDALGRYLAAPLVAREDVPGFDNSAMDGYAVRTADLAAASEDAPVRLEVTAESRAGGPLPGPLPPGEATRIFTGAPVPEGADTVVMQEDVERDGGAAIFRAPPPVDRHIRHRAEVVRAGEVILEPGLALAMGEIALGASQSHAMVPVHRRPRVAILSTGDELREIGAERAPGTLVDSNSHGLAAAVLAAGGLPWMMPLGADSLDVLTARVRGAIEGADVLVSTGGVSVGDHDLVEDAFEAAGAETIFYKVRMKPGKPVRFARAGEVPLFGLPGNPVSALVTFELFVRPLLRSRLGDPRPWRRTTEVELAAPLRAPKSRDELARARLELRDGQLPLAHPAADQGSGAMTSLRGADLFLRLPMGAGQLAEGSRVEAIDLRDPRGAARPPFGP